MSTLIYLSFKREYIVLYKYYAKTIYRLICHISVCDEMCLGAIIDTCGGCSWCCWWWYSWGTGKHTWVWLVGYPIPIIESSSAERKPPRHGWLITSTSHQLLEVSLYRFIWSSCSMLLAEQSVDCWLSATGGMVWTEPSLIRSIYWKIETRNRVGWSAHLGWFGFFRAILIINLRLQQFWSAIDLFHEVLWCFGNFNGFKLKKSEVLSFLPFSKL